MASHSVGQPSWHDGFAPDQAALDANGALQATVDEKDNLLHQQQLHIQDLTKRLEHLKAQNSKARSTLEERVRAADAEFASPSCLTSRLLNVYHGKIAPDKIDSLKYMVDEFNYDLDNPE